MTYMGLVNLDKCFEWKLSSKAVYLMIIMSDLESWANPRRSSNEDDASVYYLLYQSKMLKDIPYLGSISAISRGLNELEAKGIIAVIDRYTAPAYRLTEKGMEWKRKRVSENAKIGESEKGTSSNKDTQESETKKPFNFALAKHTTVENLSSEYMNNLFAASLEISAQYPSITNARSEFKNFIEQNSMRGNRWKNWRSAYSQWCVNLGSKKSNEGETNGRGLYG